jgi:divinyl protochlorophyllide a 8-vinyl-reductase
MSSAALPSHAGAGARIGPNAITRLAEALLTLQGEACTARVFAHAGLLARLSQPPEHMIDEAEVMRLHAALRACVGEHEAGRVAEDAGRRTGDYLLARRIPRPVQWLLKCLPARLAARVLLQAVGRHAWTFAGSGRFAIHLASHIESSSASPVTSRTGSHMAGHSDGSCIVLTLHDNPLCRGVVQDEPACAYYAATFERLFRVLVHPDARVTETECEACGGTHCRFEVRF